MPKWFITGTDTGAGKTYVSCLILKALAAEGHTAAGFKPLCCGDREDAELLLAAGNAPLSLDEVNPLWLRAPVAPYTAALLENRPIDVSTLLTHYQDLATRFDNLIVEGVGGWAVPIRADYAVADLAADLQLPVLIVVRNRLGALNHTLLTVEAVRGRGLTCRGLVLNTIEDEMDCGMITNASILEDLTGLPVLANVIHGQTEIDIDFG